MTLRDGEHTVISIVIPTYNERENIEELVSLISDSMKGYDYEIIIVDDDSPDRTWELAQELSDKYPIKVIRRVNERGLATAVIEGFKHSKGEIIVVLDADLQHPPEKIPDLIRPIIDENYDIVIGSRYIKGGGVREWNFIRKLISRGAILLSHIAIPKLRGIKDTMSGFFAIKRGVIEGVDLKPRGYKILLEILVKGKWNNVKEVPYIFGERARGRSKLGSKQMIDYVKHLIALSIWSGDFWRVIKYVTVGITGLFVNLLILYSLVDYRYIELFTKALGVSEFRPILITVPILNTVYTMTYEKFLKLFAAAISIEVSVIWNYSLNNIWTFRDRMQKGREILKGLIKFNLVSLGGILINLSVYTLLLIIFNIHYLLAETIAVFVAFAWNFVVNDYWTWSVNTSKEKDEKVDVF